MVISQLVRINFLEVQAISRLFHGAELKYVMRFAIWYHLHNFKKVKNTQGGVLILVKLQAEACNFTKINTPAWVLFTFFKLLRMVPNRTTHQI